jgi:photosystem II stability/assembly factor-like uncharacterized protein
MNNPYSRKFSSLAVVCALLVVFALAIVFAYRVVDAAFPGSAPGDARLSVPESSVAEGITARYGELPLRFEPNEGQSDQRVKFLSRGPGYDLFLTANGAVLTLQKPRPQPKSSQQLGPANDHKAPSPLPASVLRLKMLGANAGARVSGQDELPGKVNYLIGNDSDQWQTDIPTYGKVRYSEVYAGVDLIYYGNRTELEYDFVVAPGANLSAIKFQFEGAASVALDDGGDLRLNVDKSEVRLRKPVIYQLADDGQRREVKGSYSLKGNQVGFDVKSFDSQKPLIIDPVLSYSTLLGGGGDDYAYGIGVDAAGNAYITGTTTATSFPTTAGALQTTGSNYGNAFVSKLDATGTNLLYSTYLSGSTGATATAIAVDSAGNAYVTGNTTSSDFPLLNAIRNASTNFVKTTNSGANWTAKNFNPPRSITSVVIDPQTPATIYAGTNSGPGVYKSTDSGANWTALNTGSSSASVVAMVIDPITPSTLYAVTNSPSTTVIKSTNGGSSWVSLSISGTGGIYSLAIDPVTPSNLYLGSNGGVFKTTNGGSSWAQANTGLGTTAFTIAIDPAAPATIYAAGGSVFKSTNSGASWTVSNTGLPATTVHAFAIAPGNPATMYVGTTNGVFKSTNGGANWAAANSGLTTASIYSFAIDPGNNAIIYAGSSSGKIFKTLDAGNSWTPTYSTNIGLTVSSLAIDPSATTNVYAGTSGTAGPDWEAFLTQLNPSGSGLIYSTLIGGGAGDFGYGVALDSLGNAYVTGTTGSSDFMTVNPAQAALSGSTDAFVVKVNSSGSALLYSTYLGGSGGEVGNAIATDSSGNAYVTGNTQSANFPTAGAFQATAGSQFGGDAFVTKFNGNGAIGYSTYLGGNDIDSGFAIAVDSSGNAYITGTTTSSNFPTLNPVQSTNAGGFVTKLNSLGSGLVYSTYLGTGRGIAVDLSGNAYVTGYTNSPEFPTVAGALKTKSPFFTSTNSGASWSNENYGLRKDIVTTLAVNPATPSTIYAGTRSGVFKSIDGGRNWNAINTGLVRPGVVALVIDPLTPATVYLAANVSNDFDASRGVFKSTDGGTTWNAANTGLGNGGVSSLAIDPVTPSILYAGWGGGIFKSTNGGSSWSPVGSGLSLIDAIVIAPTTPTTIYAGGDSSGGGMSRSTDGGVTWQKINSGLTSTFVKCLAIDPITPSTIYAGLNGGVFKSLNSGNSWTPINNGITNTFISSLAIDPVTPSTVYATASGGGLFKSTNGGNSWTPANNGLPYLYVSTVIVNPSKPSTLYLGLQVSPPDDDAFVTKLNPAGNSFVYSTLLGGSSAAGDSSNSNDEAYAIAIDAVGNAYVTGRTVSPDFGATANSYQPFNRGFGDAFITKLTMSYIISGQVLDGSNVPVSGAVVTLNDGASLSSFVTDSSGFYQFSHLREGGSFTVSAAKPHFAMAPATQTFNNLTSDQTLNFIASASNAAFFTINGTVTNNGVGLSGVTLTLSGSQSELATSDATGNYSFTLAGGGNYTITPTLLGYTFNPPGQTFNSLSADQAANFAATRQSFVVVNANNHGTGSLRQAMLDANATAGADTIVFNIPGSGIHTIDLLVGLPEITDQVTIDATTQPGFSGSPLVELNGVGVSGGNSYGLVIKAGGSTVRGLAIGRFTAGGIWLNSSSNNTIQGNYIGVDATGTLKRSNPYGILFSNSSNNLIGGTTAAARNVISGNASAGIYLGGTNNLIQGNFIGTDATGTIALSAGSISGVNITGSNAFTNNLIGGTTPGAANLISGNGKGVYITAPGNTVQGNLIGTDVTGTKRVGNSTGVDAPAANTLIGGLTPGSRNVISGNSGNGVSFSGAGSRLQGNYIGTDITGTLELGNLGTGVVAGDSALIGGTTPEARNVISGNSGLGNISLGSNNSGSQATVQGNYIGTDVTGNVALNAPGPYIYAGISVSSVGHVIGGLVPGAPNVISGNGYVGIDIIESANNIVQGNLIGLNASATAPLPNAFGGIRISNANNNLIGGDQAGAGNRISFNGGPGIYLSSGTRNAIRGNSIFSNAELGIDAALVGVTPNDLNDPDTGANNVQNFPLLSSVASDGVSTTIQGTLNSTPNTTFRIDFYSNGACDPSGNGEGAQVMGNANVTTAADGNVAINTNLALALASGRTVTATATDPNGNTSEFSPCSSTQTRGSIQFSAPNYFVIEDVGVATITVVRTGGNKGPLSVNYSTADITAISGSDYSSVSGSLAFADGETSKMFTVPVLNDSVVEPAETMRLVLSGVADLETLGGQSTALLTIYDNSTIPTLAINSADIFATIDVPEGDSGTTNAVLKVSLLAATGRTVTADFGTVPSNATSGVDYTPVSGTLTFAPGVTEQFINVPIIGDTLDENTELFSVFLANAPNANIANSTTVRILDDDPLPGLSINDVSVTEGNSGTTTLSFTVSLAPVSGRTVRANYATANGTATSGSDFVTTSGLLTFNAGETSKTISVTVNGDTAIEANETVFVDLTSPSAATITRARGTGTINNDDGPTIEFSTANYSKSEGGGSTNITVTRTGDLSGASSVDFRTGGNSFVACDVLGGLAVQNCDFVVSAGTLSFAAGQASRTFPVMIYDDAYVEGNETLSLTLMNPVGASLGSLSAATLMILDNDSAGVPSIAPKTFVATLSSGQEVPPTGTNGKGGGLVQLDAPETGAKVGLLFSNLSSAETDAHIHGPAAPGANAPILFPLPAGTFNGFSISPTAQQVADLKANLHYMNVHSSNFTGGEIRGQLLWNPLNEAQYFVQQHYFDFLGRLPDQGGLDYWTNELNVCGTDVQCLRDRSVGVSNAFFYEDEYQQTASYVFLLYRASFGNTQPFPNPDPANPTEANKLPRYLSFVRDRAQVVGGSGLAASQLALANNFVQRPEFVTKYPLSLSTGAQFVDAVLANIQSADGATFAAPDRTALITHFNNGGRGLVMFHLANDYWNGCSRLPGSPTAPCVPAGMGAAVDNRVFIDAEYNRSFVYSQYSGYLRRDSDIDGFIFWLNQVSAAPPRNVTKQHGMVCAFITSAEYQLRFGGNAPRTNAECVP